MNDVTTKKVKGLTSAQVEENRKLGSNALSQRESESFWSMLLDSFNDTWIKILLAALVLELVFYGINLIFPGMGSDDLISPIAIGVVILAVTFIGTYISYKQDRGAKALQEEAAQIIVKVYRNNELKEISINDIVIGDWVVLQPGDKVPADGILLEGSLKVDQAALNGESREATKVVLGDAAMPSDDDLFTELKVFRGSVVTSGSAIMKVTNVGDATVLGSINVSLQEKDETLTPSEQKLEKLAGGIGKFGYIGGSIAGIINLVSGLMKMDNYTVGGIAYLILGSLVLGVSIIVMAVPEGLPLMNTLVQGLNVGKMLKDHIFVKNPKATETAGYITNLFTDKTGTLTYGKMSVANLILGDGSIATEFGMLPETLKNALIIGAGVNNDAGVDNNGKAIGSNDTDRALMHFLAVENGVTINKNIVTDTEPFDSKVKYASVTVDDIKYLKGAPDVIIGDCNYYLDPNGNKAEFSNEVRSKLQSAWDAQTNRAMRVIAVVMQKGEERTFVSLISIRDDVRSDVKSTVKSLQSAGVQVTMVTGDVISTARAIAREAGLLTSMEDLCITHNELVAMSDDELIEKLPNLKVVARAVPSDKERLVEVCKKVGKVTGMTGDGVNDAAALHKADVGFAMGSGTEVAKEAGDIIILNDSLTSIANAILYGRTMAKSVKKFLIYQLTINVSCVFTAILGLLFGWSEVFTIVQILWINMVMDTLAAIAFGKEPSRKRYMKEKPISREASILNSYLKSEIAVGAAFVTIVCLCILQNAFGIQNFVGLDTEVLVHSFMFTTFMITNIWNSFNARTESTNLLEHVTENHNFIIVMSAVALIQFLMTEFGGVVFGTYELSPLQWAICIIIGFMVIPIDMIRKVVVSKMEIRF